MGLLYLYQKKMSDQTHALATSLLGKIPQYPLDRRIGGRQIQSGCSEDEKNFLLLPGM
jgi:hypothetical protein